MTTPWGDASAARTRNAIGQWVGRTAPSRPAPKSPRAQARFLRDNVYGGSTRRMAEAYGVTQRAVERWLDGTRKMPRAAERLATEVGEVRHRRAERRTRLAAARGTPPRVRARGQIGPVGQSPAAGRRVAGTDTKRLREFPSIDLTPGQAADLADAYDRGDTDAMHDILEDVYGGYFDGGHNTYVTGADVGDIEWIEFE